MVASLVDLPDDIQSPDTVELNVSGVDDSRIGVFCVWPISKGAEFGPYEGRIVEDRDDESVDPRYSWEVFDLDTLKFLHVVDATDPQVGCWMRYVCCARFFEEQNIVSTQKGDRVFYKALKDIAAGEELLTWFQPKKKRRKRGSVRQSFDNPEFNVSPTKLADHCRPSPSSPAKSPEKQKRKRKPKIIPDSYDGPLEIRRARQSRDDMFEPLQPGQKRRRRKKLTTDSIDSVPSPGVSTPDTEDIETPVFDDDNVKSSNTSIKKEPNSEDTIVNKVSKKDVKKESGQAMSIAEINNAVEWEFPLRGEEYLFELRSHHVMSQKPGKKVYKCDICLGLYKHMFSLKRHYLRNHINYKYLSKADMTNCLINLAQVVQNMNERSHNDNIDGRKGDECDDCPDSTDVKVKSGKESTENIEPGDSSYVQTNTGSSILKSNNDIVGNEVDQFGTDSKMNLVKTLNTGEEIVNDNILKDSNSTSAKEDTCFEDFNGNSKMDENLGISGESLVEPRTDTTPSDSQVTRTDTTQSDSQVTRTDTTQSDSQVTRTDTTQSDSQVTRTDTTPSDSQVTSETSDLLMEQDDLDDSEAVVKNLDCSSDCSQASVNDVDTKCEVSVKQEKDLSGCDDGKHSCTSENESKTDHELTNDNTNDSFEKNSANENSFENGMKPDEKDSPNNVDGNDASQSTLEEGDPKTFAMRRRRRKSPTEMPGLFRCYTCYDVFDDIESVREHVQNHPESVEGSCFACDQCNMRFNYKQNLVRHKKVHEVEDLDDKEKKSSQKTKVKKEKVDVSATIMKDAAQKDSTAPIGLDKSGDTDLPEKSGVTDFMTGGKALTCQTTYRCDKCKAKFPSLPNLMKHVQDEHKSGSKYQCQYCGKDFPSLPNMKKHVRFHLGYRVSCRFCVEVFPNVGALRKHTRLSHPDIYKAKQLDKLARDGVLRKPDKKTKSDDEEPIAKPSINDAKENNKDTGKANSEMEKKEIKDAGQYMIDHDVSFAADEIDDGGSRFKFSCTICKKRFSNYINMCRHRRRAHSNESKTKTEENSAGQKRASPVLEDPVEVARFYANVSHNIAMNLNDYVDGKPESLKHFVDHITIKDYSGEFGYSEKTEQSVDISWKQYNFPPDYKPTKTISFSEIRNILDIHNDFDSHCASAGVSDSEQDDSQAKASDEDKQLVEDTTTSNEVKSLAETKGGASNVSKSSLGSAIISKSSSGLRALANAGINGAQKLSKSIENFAESLSGKRYTKVKIADGKLIDWSSPSAKNFNQVQNGEYANFENDVLPRDVDSPIVKRSNTEKQPNVAKERTTSSEDSNIPDGDNSNAQRPKKDSYLIADQMNKTAQDELQALYDSIDNNTYDRSSFSGTKSPKPLSHLCEQSLGCRPFTKSTYFKSLENKQSSRSSSVSASSGELTNDDGSLFSKLRLSANQNEGSSACDIQPDFSDAPDGSPFYNYESIAFGKNGQILSVCSVCKKSFRDYDSIIRHHWKKHPSTVFNFLEVEQGNNIDKLHFTEPSCVGALAVTDPGFDYISEMESFTCTRCGSIFRTVSKLHVHIIDCSLIDPVYGSIKSEQEGLKTPVTPVKKKTQKKHLGSNINENEEKSKQECVTEPKKETGIVTVGSQKRVFTGCRKRTAMILPDSPVKMYSIAKQNQDVTTGYNPSNHVRRRELTELVDTLTCEACGLKFKTIILLERHVKNCTKKEKFKNVKPMTCPIMDESLARLKNICIYCDKNFTYTKSLMNHLQDFCPVKKLKLDKGELTKKDKEREEEIIERHLKQENEKLLKEKEAENATKKRERPTWQVGRKVKRKGHAWTYIKKRKQVLASTDITEGDDDEMVEDYVISDNMFSHSDALDNTIEENECEDAIAENISNVEKCDDEEKHGQVEKNTNESEKCLPEKETIAEDSKQTDSDKKIDSTNISDNAEADAVLEQSSKIFEINSPNEHANEKELNMVDKENPPVSPVPVNSKEDEEIESNTEDNLSLNCTARYNTLNPSCKESSAIKNKPKSSLFLQCVSKQQRESTESVKPVTEIIGSKRKRARIGKVEEFLRNAFKRKRRRKNLEEPKSSTENIEIVDSTATIGSGKDTAVVTEPVSTLSKIDNNVQPTNISKSEECKETDNSTPVTETSVEEKLPVVKMTLSNKTSNISKLDWSDKCENTIKEETAKANDCESGLTLLCQPKGTSGKVTADSENTKRRPEHPVKTSPMEQIKNFKSLSNNNAIKDISGPLQRKRRSKKQIMELSGKTGDEILMVNINEQDKKQTGLEATNETDGNSIPGVKLSGKNIQGTLHKKEELITSETVHFTKKAEFSELKKTENVADSGSNEIEQRIESYTELENRADTCIDGEPSKLKLEVQGTQGKTKVKSNVNKKEPENEDNKLQNKRQRREKTSKHSIEMVKDEPALTSTKECDILTNLSSSDTNKQIISHMSIQNAINERTVVTSTVGKVDGTESSKGTTNSVIASDVKLVLTIDEQKQGLPMPNMKMSEQTCSENKTSIKDESGCENVKMIKGLIKQCENIPTCDSNISSAKENNKMGNAILKRASKEKKEKSEVNIEEVDGINKETLKDIVISSPEPAEQEGTYQLVLSPSERVKMNKRSCKKETNPFSPVWVKRTYKPKPKVENDSKKSRDESFHETSTAKQAIDKIKPDSAIEKTCLKTYLNNFKVGHAEKLEAKQTNGNLESTPVVPNTSTIIYRGRRKGAERAHDQGSASREVSKLIKDAKGKKSWSNCVTDRQSIQGVKHGNTSKDGEFVTSVNEQNDCKKVIEQHNAEPKFGKRKLDNTSNTDPEGKCAPSEVKVRKSDEVRNRIKEKLTKISQERDKKQKEKQRKSINKRT